jgi:hypothetical protein
MDVFVESLRQERDRLKAELRTDPRQRRLELLEELLASYPEEAIPSPPPRQTQTRPHTNGHARPESKASKVRRMIIELLGQAGETHRTVILNHLVSAGVMGDEKNPMAQLAAYLSDNRDLFASDGVGNFTLLREREAE